MDRGLPSHKVWSLARVPPSTLNYWVQTRLITPTVRRPDGKRVEQWWSLNQVVTVKAIRALRQSGASLQVIRKAKRLVEERGDSLSGTRLVWDGNDIGIVDGNGSIQRVSDSEQLLFFVFDAPIGEWYSEVAEHAEEVDRRVFRRQARVRQRKRDERIVPTSQALPAPNKGSAKAAR